MLSLGYARYNNQDFNEQWYQDPGNLSEAMGRGSLVTEDPGGVTFCK